MAGGVLFAELHTQGGERQDGSQFTGVATSPTLLLFKRRRGQLFTVVEPSLPGAGQLCKQIIETIEDEYFRDSSRAVTTSLSQAIALANERLRAENSRFPPDRQLRVGLSCAAIRQGDVYIAQVAPGNAFVLHGGQVKRVFSTYSLSPDTGVTGTDRASDSLGSQLQPHVNFGYSPLEEGDLVVLASGANWKLIPDRYILDAARHVDQDMSASELYDCYLAHASRPSTSIMVIRISELPARQGRNGHDQEQEKPPQRPGEVRQATQPVAPAATGRVSSERAKPLVSPIPSNQTRPREREEQPRRPASARDVQLAPVGKPSVKLRGEWERPGAGGGLLFAFKLLLALLVVAAVLAAGWKAYEYWNAWQLGDPLALTQEADQKRAAVMSAESPAAARTLLVQSYDLYQRSLRAGSDEGNRQKAATVLADIDKVDRTVRVSQATQLLDFTGLVAQNGEPTHMAIDGSSLYVMDEGLDTLSKYQLGQDRSSVQDAASPQLLLKKGDKLDGARITDMLAMAWMPAGQLRASPGLFALESGRAVAAYDPKGTISRVEIAESDKWGNIESIAGFAGGLYLLDTGVKAVFYYPPTKNGYESQPYTVVDSKSRVDFSNAKDLALDGNLYVLEANGSIKRFNKEGRPQEFGGELPDGAMKGARRLHASAATRSVYVLDEAGERIVQYSPEGKLQRQFKAAGDLSFKEMRDIWVDEVGLKLYVLARKSLFVFAMPQLQQ